MKKTLLLLVVLCVSLGAFAQKPYTLTSPDGQIKLSIQASAAGMIYDVAYQGKEILTGNKLGLTVNKKVLPVRVAGKKQRSAHQSFRPVVPIRFSQIEKDYNELELTMKDGYSVCRRAYNEGVAYRFKTRFKGEMEVDAEELELGVPADYMLHLQQDDRFTSAYENAYSHVKSGEWTSGKNMACLPVLIDAGSCHVLVSEADHYDYPRFFMIHSEAGLKATFPKVWLKERKTDDRHTLPVEEAEYIAKTAGTRNLPWRYMVIGDAATLAENTLCANLSSDKCEIEDVSWIRPGKVSWDWWNGKMVYGPDVNFKSGINTDTYKYYIDFASKNNIEYIILDEGWNVEVNRPFDVIPALDIPELVRYGKEKNVGLILWVTWYAVREHPEIFKTYSDWGVKGMKIDFMERTDQEISNFYENTVREAAKYHLLVDFHGAYTPAGLEYRYPNLLAYEGVRGMEQMENCTPDNSLYFPFMRNAVGAMDYTPGAMLSVQPRYRVTGSPNAMSVGTRAYQLALFITCETGTQMLADSPTRYYKNPDCLEFIKDVPVLWDETKVLDAKVGQYIVMAKRSGDKWYIAAETNSNERQFNVKLNFLASGKKYHMTSFSDGPNSDYQAMDYRRNESQVDSTTTLSIQMVKNGGFAAVLE